MTKSGKPDLVSASGMTVYSNPGIATSTRKPLIIRSVPATPRMPLPMTSQPTPETMATEAITIAICNSTSA